MNTPSLILLIVFGVFSCVHLVFCFLEMEKIRKISKCFCLAALTAAAIVARPDLPFIYIGAALGCVGDFLLIENQNIKRFAAGTAVFLISHALYFVQFCLSAKLNMPFWGYLLAFSFWGVELLVFYKTSFKITNNKLVGCLGAIYLPNLIFMALCGVHLIVSASLHNNSVLPGIVFLVGYLSFFLSDVILTNVTFIKDFKRRDFPIMFSYLLGEVCIVVALLLV